MFDRLFFSLSMFLFRVFHGFTAGHAAATATKSDEPFYVTNFESFQDFDHDRH
jgi:hypothetical protein